MIIFSKYNLRVKQQLDRETQKFYNIPFQTEDSKRVSGIRFLTIEVDDVNDSPMTNGESQITVYNFEVNFNVKSQIIFYYKFIITYKINI